MRMVYAYHSIPIVHNVWGLMWLALSSSDLSNRQPSMLFRYNSDEKVQDITAHNKEFLYNHSPYQL